MMYKIKYGDFLKTFTKKQLQDIKEYNLVMAFHKKGYSRKEIKKRVNVSLDKLHQWRNERIKPNSVKTLNEIKRKGYFEPISDDKMEWLAYLVGYNLGDGNVSRNLCNVWFYGVNTDLENIKKLLLGFKVKPVIYTYKVNNGKMAVHDRTFSRFLVCLGAIIGDKTKSKIEIPNWILKSKKASKFKKRFLQGFFDSELSNIKKIENKKLSHQSLNLYTSKHENFIKNGKFFLNQIRTLLIEFGVLSSEVKFNRTYKRRRDNSKMQELYIVIYSNYINLHNLIKNIGFLYNLKRRKRSIIIFNEIKNKAKNELFKIEQYNKALILRKTGLSAYKIAEKLNLKINDTKYWLYKGGKPVLFDFVKKLNNF